MSNTPTPKGKLAPDVVANLAIAALSFLGGLLVGRTRTMADAPQKGSVDYWNKKFQNNKYIAPVIVGSLVVIGVGSLIEAIGKICDFVTQLAEKVLSLI